MKTLKVLSFVDILVLPLIFLCGSAFAQSFPTDKGSKMVSGSFSFSSMGGDLYEEDGDRIMLIQFTPSVSYFTEPGFAFGGKLMLLRYSIGDHSLTAWSIGPQLLYFLGENKPKVAVKGAIYP